MEKFHWERSSFVTAPWIGLDCFVCEKEIVTQSCWTLCDPVDCSPPGCSVHGILQASILEKVAIPFSRGSSRPWDQTWVFHIAGGSFTIWATREAHFACSSVLTVFSLKPNSQLERLLEALGHLLWPSHFWGIFQACFPAVYHVTPPGPLDKSGRLTLGQPVASEVDPLPLSIELETEEQQLTAV